MTEEPKGKVYHDEGGIKQMLYDERKATVERLWELYEKTQDKNGDGDLECLAIICERLPFFENQQVGQEIARHLRKSQKRSKGWKHEQEKERIRRMDEIYKRAGPQLMKKQRIGFLQDIFPHLTTKQIEGIID